MGITPEPQRFYDPITGPGSAVSVELKRVRGDGPEEWFVTHPIAYRDRHFEERGEPDIVVPRAVDDFRSDLTSVPQMFTWLVSRSGTHLPAALVHDALTLPFRGRDPITQEPLPDWTGPAAVTQVEADRVFRDAMADLGTPPVRRWMVWSAVTVPTAWKVSKWRALLGYVGLGVIVVIGWLATLDLFDQGELLPWMCNRAWWLELLLGAAMAIVIPLVLSLVWPKGTRQAGAIVGVGIGALIHVTVVVAAVTFAYQFAEYRFGVWGQPKRWLKVLITVGAVAAVALTWWMIERN